MAKWIQQAVKDGREEYRQKQDGTWLQCREYKEEYPACLNNKEHW